MSKLPQGWEQPKLKEVVQHKKGKKPKALNEVQKEDFLPYVDIKAFEKNIIAKYAHVDDGVLAQPNDTLMVWDGARSGLVGKGVKGLIGSTLSRLTPKTEKINRDYLHHYFVSQFSFINSNTKGTGIPHVDPAKLWDLDFPLPPLDEQKRIADKLDSVLAKVEAAQARLDKIPTILKRFRQSVLAAATSGELTKDWREENDFEKPSLDEIESYWKEQFLKQNRKFKSYTSQTDHEDIIGWLPSKLGSICDVHVGSTPKRTESSYWKGDVKWVSSSEVAFCEIFDTKETITYEGLKNSSTKLHPSGTVMLAMIGQGKTRGQPAILRTEACHNQNTAALRIPEPHLLPEYLYYWLWERYEETRKIGAGNNQKALNKATVQSIDINLPTLEEQKIIVQKVEQLFENANTVEKQYNAAKARLDKLTQSILAKAFRGELIN